MKQQQNLYENVRTDRNMYSKNLIESQDEVQELKRKFKIMSHQIEQLKEEINVKDVAMVKEHFDHMKSEKEKMSLKAEVSKSKQIIESSENELLKKKNTIIQLNDQLKEIEQVLF